jgi:hypothetical protein
MRAFETFGRSPTGRAIRFNALPLGQTISTAIPNAENLRACWEIVFGRKNGAFLSETRQILQP